MLAVAADPEAELEAEPEAAPETEPETEPGTEPDAGIIAPNVTSVTLSIASPKALLFSSQFSHLGFEGTLTQKALRSPCSDSKKTLFVLAGLKAPTSY